jgi:putative transposase
MWTEITRPKSDRKGMRYASHVTDAEWSVILPRLPEAKPLGRPRGTELRAVVDALFLHGKDRMPVEAATK